jgi:hypothetical protein
VAAEGSMARFINRAKIVVRTAQNEARDRGHEEITSVHLLLGLIAEWKGLEWPSPTRRRGPCTLANIGNPRRL